MIMSTFKDWHEVSVSFYIHVKTCEFPFPSLHINEDKCTTNFYMSDALLKWELVCLCSYPTVPEGQEALWFRDLGDPLPVACTLQLLCILIKLRKLWFWHWAPGILRLQRHLQRFPKGILQMGVSFKCHGKIVDVFNMLRLSYLFIYLYPPPHPRLHHHCQDTLPPHLPSLYYVISLCDGLCPQIHKYNQGLIESHHSSEGVMEVLFLFYLNLDKKNSKSKVKY